MKFKLLAFLVGLSQISNVYAAENSISFFGNLFQKAGSKATDTVEGKDIEKFQKAGQCRKLYPWSEPKIKDVEVNKRLLFICRNSFYIQYDPLLKMPISVSEVLTKANMLYAEEPKNYKKSLDPDLPNNIQSKLEDYDNQKEYVSGQLAAAGNMTIFDESLEDNLLIELNRTARTQSYFLSNTAPMVYNNFYNGIWRDLENSTRDSGTKSENIYVTTGPIFLNGQHKGFFGSSQIPIPTHFYKVITDPLTYGSVAYIIPNKEIITANSKSIVNPKDVYYCSENGAKKYCELGDFIVPIREVEKVTGIEFYPILAPYYAVQVKQDINQIFKNKKKRLKID